MKVEYSLTIESGRPVKGGRTLEWIPIESAAPTSESLDDYARIRWVIAGVPVIDESVGFGSSYLLALSRRWRRRWSTKNSAPTGLATVALFWRSGATARLSA